MMQIKPAGRRRQVRTRRRNFADPGRHGSPRGFPGLRDSLNVHDPLACGRAGLRHMSAHEDRREHAARDIPAAAGGLTDL